MHPVAEKVQERKLGVQKSQVSAQYTNPALFHINRHLSQWAALTHFPDEELDSE